MERRSSSPSFNPGQQTIWQFITMPPSANRRMISRLSPARGFPSMKARSSGFVVCTETLMGLMCRSRMRCTSRLERFVSVI